MTEQLTDRVQRVLSDRRHVGLLRELRSPRSMACDFSSNDYLGFARSEQFQAFLTNYLHENPPESTGSTGSRLLTGHSESVSSLEILAARFHKAADAIIFNSGYDANLSFLSCIPGPNDAIVYDELIHASVHDGMRMSRARTNLHSFAHNDLHAMKQVVRQASLKQQGSIIVCIETVYSMDGDVAPVQEMLDSCAQLTKELQQEVHLVADEAHAGGVFGENGEGIIVQVGAQRHPNLLATVVTFGKAFAVHGAVILTHGDIKLYLINYARPLIYSTALPPHSIIAIHAAYGFAKTKIAQKARERLWLIIKHFQREVRKRLSSEMVAQKFNESPIQCIRVAGNQECVNIAQQLRRYGFDVYPIRSPTVPRGTERIRVILHAHNTTRDVDHLITSIIKELDSLTTRSRL